MSRYVAGLQGLRFRGRNYKPGEVVEPAEKMPEGMRQSLMENGGLQVSQTTLAGEEPGESDRRALGPTVLDKGEKWKP